MRYDTERFQAAQDQSRPQSCNRYPHASTSFYTPLTRNSDVPGMFKFVPLLGDIGHQTRLNRNISFMTMGAPA